MKLLFNIPLLWGVILTACDVFLIMHLQKKGFRYLEAVVIAIILVIAVCFFLEIYFSQPNFLAIAKGFIPDPEILTNPQMLYLSIGILGATVMPHNLYLHSSVVQTRSCEDSNEARKEAIRFVNIDSGVALTLAFFVNAAILIMSAAVFHTNGQTEIAEIEEAYKLLSPQLGVGVASTLFAIALLASGQNSTLTGTLAGQIVMEGFLDLRLKPWLRRLITRGLAIIPAIICIAWYGENSIGNLLIVSQVILSLQLGFAVLPLILFTNDSNKMGVFVNSRGVKIVAWICALFIIGLNLKYIFDFLRSF